jgi:hypothetical protein
MVHVFIVFPAMFDKATIMFVQVLDGFGSFHVIKQIQVLPLATYHHLGDIVLLYLRGTSLSTCAKTAGNSFSWPIKKPLFPFFTTSVSFMLFVFFKFNFAHFDVLITV